MVEHDVGHALMLPVSGDRDGRQGQRVRQVQVDGNKTLNPTLEKQTRVLLKQLGIVPVYTGDEEVIFLPGVVLDAADDERAISFSDVMGDDPDGVSPLFAERAREEIRPIIQFTRRRQNTGPGVLGNVLGRGRVVEHRRDRSGRQADMLGDRLQGHDATGRTASLFALRHGFPRMRFPQPLRPQDRGRSRPSPGLPGRSRQCIRRH